MAKGQFISKKITVQNVQVGFPWGLFEASTPKGYDDAKPRFGAPFAFDAKGEQAKAIQAAVKAVIKEAKAVNEDFAPSPSDISYDAKSKLGEGLSQIRAYSREDYPPKIFGRQLEKLTKEDDKVDHGSVVNVEILVYAYGVDKGRAGIAFGINAVQYVEAGDLEGGGDAGGSFTSIGAADEEEGGSAFSNIDAPAKSEAKAEAKAEDSSDDDDDDDALFA